MPCPNILTTLHHFSVVFPFIHLFVSAVMMLDQKGK